MKKICLLGLVALFLAASGCSQIMGNLRQDFDDSDTYSTAPTVGGRWAEKGQLADEDYYSQEQYYSVGHNERNPASAG